MMKRSAVFSMFSGEMTILHTSTFHMFSYTICPEPEKNTHFHFVEVDPFPSRWGPVMPENHAPGKPQDNAAVICSSVWSGSQNQPE